MKQDKQKDSTKVENVNSKENKSKKDDEKKNVTEKVDVKKDTQEKFIEKDEKNKDKDGNFKNKDINENKKDEKSNEKDINSKEKPNNEGIKDIDEKSRDKEKKKEKYLNKEEKPKDSDKTVDRDMIKEKENSKKLENNVKKDKNIDYQDVRESKKDEKKAHDKSFDIKEEKLSINEKKNQEKNDRSNSSSQEKNSQKKESSSKQLDNNNHEHNSSGNENSSKKEDPFQKIKVFVRVRPFMKNEIEKGNVIFVNPRDDRNIKIGKNHFYFESSYEKTFGSFSNQKDIFRSVKNSVDQVINGTNSTILTYGQTGSGKTFTMFGADWTKYERLDSTNDILEKNDLRKSVHSKRDDIFISDMIINPYSEENGIIPRIINYLFSELKIFNIKTKKYLVYVSFLQIYNENIYDLLDEEQNIERQTSLKIGEDKLNGIYVEDLTEFLVENVYDCLNLLKRGERTRKRRQTKKNDLSSRSHTIFQIIVEYDRVNDKGILKRSKLNLCDLAGSEKFQNDNEKNSLEQQNEIIKINQSLSTLEQVIHSLSINQNNFSYKDSKLTRILQDSLGGNTITYLISTLSPSWDTFEESLKTLKFSDKAKLVKSQIKFSESNINSEKLIRNLKEEIHNLKDILDIRKKRGNITSQEEEIIKLKKENEKLRQYVLSNTEVQKIVGDNKKLNSKVAKLENELYQNINNIKDLELSHQKDLSKFDPFYGEKNDIYENNLDNNYNPNYKQEYNKQFPLERKYENYENDKNQDPYYYNNENHSDYRLNSNYQPYNNDNKQYNQKINNKHNENIPFLDQSNKKIFSKHQSPTLKRNEIYPNYSNSLNIKGRYHPNSYHKSIGNNINLSSPSKNMYPPINNINKYNYDYRSKNSNLLLGGEMIVRKGNGEDPREKNSNDRLRILENLEYKTGLNLQKEIEKIENEKRRIKEEKWMKSLERKKNYERIENKMKKIKYLYEKKDHDDSYNHLYRPKYDSIEHHEDSFENSKKKYRNEYANDDDIDNMIKNYGNKYDDDKFNSRKKRNKLTNSYGETHEEQIDWKPIPNHESKNDHLRGDNHYDDNIKKYETKRNKDDEINNEFIKKSNQNREKEKEVKNEKYYDNKKNEIKEENKEFKKDKPIQAKDYKKETNEENTINAKKENNELKGDKKDLSNEIKKDKSNETKDDKKETKKENNESKGDKTDKINEIKEIKKDKPNEIKDDKKEIKKENNEVKGDKTEKINEIKEIKNDKPNEIKDDKKDKPNEIKDDKKEIKKENNEVKGDKTEKINETKEIKKDKPNEIKNDKKEIKKEDNQKAVPNNNDGKEIKKDSKEEVKKEGTIDNKKNNEVIDDKQKVKNK